MTQSSPRYSSLYPPGDYEWFACDASGHVAVFTTAEIGPIPLSVLSHRPATDAFVGVLETMPPRGSSTLLVSLPDARWFKQIASCGFFAYDWQDVHRTSSFSQRYEMLSRPGSPIHIAELPVQLQPLVSRTTFTGLRFSDSIQIDVRAFFDCDPAA